MVHVARGRNEFREDFSGFIVYGLGQCCMERVLNFEGLRGLWKSTSGPMPLPMLSIIILMPHIQIYGTLLYAFGIIHSVRMSARNPKL